MGSVSKTTPWKATGKDGKVRYGVVGLGYISQAAALPAFEHAQENSQLVALVSDDPAKLAEVGEKYSVERTCSYDEYDSLLASGAVDAVYIGLPNSMHREYTERAARAGVHVLCEKPMAVTEEDCEAMIRACEQAGVKLMIAYRLHFEEANLKTVELAHSGALGDVRFFDSVFCQQVKEGDIRLQRALGGGPLYDMGIYCINAARYLFRQEPAEVVAVSANSGDPRFREVNETVSAILRFPQEQLAQFVCSFGASSVSAYRLVGTKGDVRLDPAYEFAKELVQYVTIDEKTKENKFSKRDQFAPELVYFSDCVLANKQPQPSGQEGLADVRIIRALLRSIESGKPVQLGPFDVARRPGIEQEIHKPPVKMPEMVHAAPPSAGT